MKYEESKLQQQCVAWFRAQYPQYAMLLTHPINEGGRNTRVSGAIHKGEGTVAGVPDLLFFMYAEYKIEAFGQDLNWIKAFYGLGIEMKTKTGRQSQQQKDFQKMFEAAGYKYQVVRSIDEFRALMNEYIRNAPDRIRRSIDLAHVEIDQATRQREKEHFYKVIGKK